MKFKRHILMSFFVICFFACKKTTKETDSRINKFSQLIKEKNISMPLIMAHRGLKDNRWPENAIESFEETHRLSNQLLIEFDVRVTKDDVYVLLHDDSLNRTTTGDGLLSERKFKEVSEFRLISNTGDTTEFKVPKLEEALEWGKSKNIMVIDAKPECDIKYIVRMVEDQNAVGNSLIICYSIEDALLYNKLNPDLILAIGFNSWGDLEKIKKSGLLFENLIALTPTSLQKGAFYTEIKKLGVDIAYGTYKTLDRKEFDAVKDIYKQHAMQFDIIITDRPQSVYELLSEKE